MSKIEERCIGLISDRSSLLFSGEEENNSPMQSNQYGSHWAGKAWAEQAVTSGFTAVPFCALLSCSEPGWVTSNPN